MQHVTGFVEERPDNVDETKLGRVWNEKRKKKNFKVNYQNPDQKYGNS